MIQKTGKGGKVYSATLPCEERNTTNGRLILFLKWIFP